MKKILFIISLILSFLFTVDPLFAQYRSESSKVTTRVGNPVGGGGDVINAPDGVHACPLTGSHIDWPGSYDAIPSGSFSWICQHCHVVNGIDTRRAIDMGTAPAGGNPVVAVTDGRAVRYDTPLGGNAIYFYSNDGNTYWYAHLNYETRAEGNVTKGQTIGYTAPAGESSNNGVSHLHISATTNSDHTRPNIPVGPLLDLWCGTNVCGGTQTLCE